MKYHIVYRWLLYGLVVPGILGERPCSWTFPSGFSAEVLSFLQLPPRSDLSGKVLEGICLPSNDCPFFQQLDLWRNKSKILSPALCDFHDEDNGINTFCCPNNLKPRSSGFVPDFETDNSTVSIVTPKAETLAFNDALHPNRHLLPGTMECGQEGTIDNRIINGEDAGLGTFPWSALVGYAPKYSRNPTIDFHCGGTLINNRYVLTAAHCLTEAEKNNYEMKVVRLGEYDTSKAKDCVVVDSSQRCSADPVDIPIEEVVVHADYERNVRFQHDIALIRLTRKVNFTDWVKPACLPFGEPMTCTNENYAAIVAGWGKLGIDRPYSNVLQKADVFFTDMEKCKKAYRQQADINFSQQFCAVGKSAQDACPGDSGGPLMVRGQFHGRPQTFVVGVVSFGPENCGHAPEPGVYTWIPAYFKWILDQIKK